MVLQWSFVATLRIIEARCTCKMNIQMALKSKSYIDLVKLSLGIFFFLCCSMEIFFIQAFRIFLYFCRKHAPKIHKLNVFPNLTCGNSSLDGNLTIMSNVCLNIYISCDKVIQVLDRVANKHKLVKKKF